VWNKGKLSELKSSEPQKENVWAKRAQGRDQTSTKEGIKIPHI